MRSLRSTLVCAGLCLVALSLGSYAHALSFDWRPGDSGSGWVGTAHGAGARSAQQEYVRAMHVLAEIFDEAPTFWGVVSDRNDTIAQMPFLGVWRGTRIAGLAVASVRGGQSTIGVAFDDASRAPLTMDGLVRQLGQDVPLIAPPEALQPEVWERHRFVDGTGHVSVPRGWSLQFAREGRVQVAGPSGENVTLSWYQTPWLPEWTTQWTRPGPGTIVAPYQDPLTAIHTVWPTAVSWTGKAMTVGSVLWHTNNPSQRGELSASMLWEETWEGRPYLAYGYVHTFNLGIQWLFYIDSVRAPTEVFAESFPTMMDIWSSWTIEPEVYWQRMQSAMRNMAEASDILYETMRDTSRRREARMYDWSEAYRGSAIVRDARTGEEMPANLAFVQETVDGLNQAAGSAVYEYVPLREWWQGR